MEEDWRKKVAEISSIKVEHRLRKALGEWKKQLPDDAHRALSAELTDLVRSTAAEVGAEDYKSFERKMRADNWKPEEIERAQVALVEELAVGKARLEEERARMKTTDPRLLWAEKQLSELDKIDPSATQLIRSKALVIAAAIGLQQYGGFGADQMPANSKAHWHKPKGNGKADHVDDGHKMADPRTGPWDVSDIG